jgi:hypothetical protein
MRNIAHKTTGDTLTADEFNDIPAEEENLIESAGIVLTSSDLYQEGKAVAKYASQVNFTIDSGAADAYVLTTVAPMQAPPAYEDGLRISFRPLNSNTGTAAATLNFNSLGIKTIKQRDGVTDLDAAYLETNVYSEVVYNSSTGFFTLQSQPATDQTWKTADIKFTGRVAADTGWIMGTVLGTIGDATSAATIRANIDCENLFKYYWDNCTDLVCPVTGGRGVNAAADWSAHKKIQIPAYQNQALGVMGTTHAFNSQTGSETHTLSIAEMPAHNHTGTYVRYSNDTGPSYTRIFGHDSNFNGTPDTDTIVVASQGGGTAHSIMQPTYFVNIMIKL